MTVTRSRLAADLRQLGVRAGGVTLVHTRMSSLGWVVGSSETVVRALLDALGPGGTLMAYASWEEHVYRAEERPEQESRDAYLAEPPSSTPPRQRLPATTAGSPSGCGRGRAPSTAGTPRRASSPSARGRSG